MKLNLGCGSRPDPGYVNVDIVEQPGVDVVHDLDCFPWPWADEAADGIFAWDVYEHVNDPLGFMAECHRVLEPGGLLVIHTAYWQNPNSFADPTHKRFLTEDSFDYWVPGTPRHRDYGAAYARGATFEKVSVWLDHLPAPHRDLNVTLRKVSR